MSIDFFSHAWISGLISGWQLAVPRSHDPFLQAALAGAALHPSGVGWVTLGAGAAPVAVETFQESSGVIRNSPWAGVHLQNSSAAPGNPGKFDCLSSSPWDMLECAFPKDLAIGPLAFVGWGVGFWGVTPGVVPWLLFQGCQHWTTPPEPNADL